MGRSKSIGSVVLSLGLALVVGAAACDGGAKVEAPVEAGAKAEAPIEAGAKAEAPTTVSLTAEGQELNPPVQPEAIPEEGWYCDMGTVHYARSAEGDGTCPLCKMKLKQKVAAAP